MRSRDGGQRTIDRSDGCSGSTDNVNALRGLHLVMQVGDTSPWLCGMFVRRYVMLLIWYIKWNVVFASYELEIVRLCIVGECGEKRRSRRVNRFHLASFYTFGTNHDCPAVFVTGRNLTRHLVLVLMMHREVIARQSVQLSSDVPMVSSRLYVMSCDPKCPSSRRDLLLYYSSGLSLSSLNYSPYLPKNGIKL